VLRIDSLEPPPPKVQPEIPRSLARTAALAREQLELVRKLRGRAVLDEAALRARKGVGSSGNPNLPAAAQCRGEGHSSGSAGTGGGRTGHRLGRSRWSEAGLGRRGEVASQAGRPPTDTETAPVGRGHTST
jgi:hypothetical protein